MAIPNRALRLSIDVSQFTTAEMRQLDAIRNAADARDVMRVCVQIAAFLDKYGNWTPAEVEALTLPDYESVMISIQDQLAVAAVPKASTSPSAGLLASRTKTRKKNRN